MASQYLQRKKNCIILPQDKNDDTNHQRFTDHLQTSTNQHLMIYQKNFVNQSTPNDLPEAFEQRICIKYQR